MHATSRSFTDFAATGIAVAGITALAAAPLAPPPQVLSPPVAAHDVRLAAASVPPGGLVASFLGNQLIYCSLICPHLVQLAVTVPIAVLQTPGTFVTALQSGDLLKAVGAAAASVTGAADAAATAAIVPDGTIVAPRAWNALEVAVVGLLNVVPAAAGGLPGIVTAIETARQDTFTALNRPLVPNPTPTVMPHGVLQVAVVEGLNVVAAVIFPGFNAILQGGFDTVDAVAQTLARTGDPVAAVAAGATTATRALTEAGSIVADSVVTAVGNIRTAIDQSHPRAASAIEQSGPPDASGTEQVEKQSTVTKPIRARSGTSPQQLATSNGHVSAEPHTARTLRDEVSKIRHTVRRAVQNAAERTHRTKSDETGVRSGTDDSGHKPSR
jgi:hypothetical protein